MSYEKYEWKDDDIITAEKLNHMEDGIAGGTPMMSVTHAELLAIRNAGTLIPGMQYRITDYVCTTTQDESRAVSHPFDIIVTADDTGMLNENARAVKKDGDTYYQYADLSAWELKYCLDNDGDRFKWADTTNGHGVVYYMKDDHNNECPYDFKQIQFKRYPITECAVSSLVGKYAAAQHGEVITGIDEQNPVWCYTFSYNPDKTGVMSDSSVMEFNVDNEADVSGNIINASYDYQDPDEWVGLKVVYLNNIVFIGSSCNSNTFGDGCNSNTFGNGCNSNTFGDGCISNTFGNNCSFNTFGDYCNDNTFGNNCNGNTFGNYCNYIDISAGTGSQRKQFYHVLDGVQGTSSSHISITGANGNSFVTYVGMNSSGTLKTWVPADLV